ncbi:MAG: class I SAM-dependent methyltransferase [Methylococcaceae bacterium]|nr:class I SAM-dependent methyltransferase [Methylococcaceae bacterium]
MSVEKLLEKYFGNVEHPYRTYENTILGVLRETDTILDAGCGSTTPVLRKFIGKAHELIGIDLEEHSDVPHEIRYFVGNISSIPVPDESVDVVISRAVLEHVEHPEAVFRELQRILKPGGSFIFLAPNLYDYASIISLIVPNRWHKYIVGKTEGRKSEDVFPAYYRANTYSAVKRLCDDNHFEILSFKWLGQYPSYFMFSSILFYIATGYEKLISRFECLRFLRGWILVHIKKNPA